MIFDEIGEMAIGSRLRLLSDVVTKDAQKIYDLYEVDFKPNWFPVFYCLTCPNKEKSITAIAREIRHSHPSVIKMVREMVKGGLVIEKKDVNDGRKNIIELTENGVELAKKMEVQFLDVKKAIDETLHQTKHNLWLAIQEFDFLLNQKSLYHRVLEQKKIRESSHIKIVEYHPKFKKHFKKLNEEWITEFFRMEEADVISLENPESYILEKGGTILFALEEDEVLGTCALIKMDNPKFDFELAKMAVSPKAHGKGIGNLIGNAIIQKAKELGGKNIYLESNTILKSAISLYQKLGFKKVGGNPSPYERSNIQMVLDL